MDLIKDCFLYWEKGGLLLLPIGIVCFFIWAYMIRLNKSLKAAIFSLTHAVRKGEQTFSINNKVPRVTSIEKGPVPGFIDQVNQCLSSPEKIERLFDNFQRQEKAVYERDMSVLQALVTASPLLGLLGTVMGMISTFNALAYKSAGMTELMASGISQALITTKFGLVVALPGLFGLSVIRRQFKTQQTLLSSLRHHITSGKKGNF